MEYIFVLLKGNNYKNLKYYDNGNMEFRQIAQ